MNIPTPQQQRWLCAKLPELIECNSFPQGISFQIWKRNNMQILDTEWDNIVRQVEGKLTDNQHKEFRRQLVGLTHGTDKRHTEERNYVSADPATRTTALMQTIGG